MSGLSDVAIVGAGVVGTAIARELVARGAKVAIIEASSDVGTGTSKANTAILHTGFDAPPGTLEARLVTRGQALLRAYAETAGIAVEDTGAVLVAWNEAERASFPEIRAKALQNGVTAVEELGPGALYDLEPHLGRGALGALRIRDESIVCPFTPPIAFATQAVEHGAALHLSSPVRTVERTRDGYRLQVPYGEILARWVVNAAGLASDRVDRMFGHEHFRVVPRRGELIVFDKLARPLLRHVILPVPTKRTKGVLVAPTVFGNVLLGPTAEDVRDIGRTDTTESGLASLLEHGRRILPSLLHEEVTSSYAGLRAATEPSGYQIRVDGAAQYACIGGIRSTGLSAAMGIAEYVAKELSSVGLALSPARALAPPKLRSLGERSLRPYQDEALVQADPDHGSIVCHCERVTRAEIRDAFRSTVPAKTLDGLRRRTRCLQGRCQGFFCLASVAGALAEARDVSIDEVLALGTAR